MTRALRPGQARALALWAEALRAGSRSELVVVPVGYGKTVIGVGSFEVAANLAGADTCLYLTPTYLGTASLLDNERTNITAVITDSTNFVLPADRTGGKHGQDFQQNATFKFRVVSSVDTGSPVMSS